MSKSVYVVMEQNFEYTDEYYYSTNGGEPVRAYLTKMEASTEAGRLNEQFIVTHDSHSLAEYFHGQSQGDRGWDDCVKAAQGDTETRLAFAEEIEFSVFYVAEVKVEPNAERQELPDTPDFEFDE